MFYEAKFDPSLREILLFIKQLKSGLKVVSFQKMVHVKSDEGEVAAECDELSSALTPPNLVPLSLVPLAPVLFAVAVLASVPLTLVSLRFQNYFDFWNFF